MARLATMLMMLKKATMTPMYLRVTRNLVASMRLKFPNMVLNDASRKSLSRSMSPYLFQSTFFMLEKTFVMPWVAVVQVLVFSLLSFVSSFFGRSSWINISKVPIKADKFLDKFIGATNLSQLTYYNNNKAIHLQM